MRWHFRLHLLPVSREVLPANMLALLKRLEWCGVNRWGDSACPVCWGAKPGEPGVAHMQGHRNRCEMAAAIVELGGIPDGRPPLARY